VASDPKPGWRRAQLSKKDRILRSTGLHDKTLWDWLQLLVVPIVIALLAGLFTTVQIVYQQAAEERLQSRITEQNAEIQRFIEEQRSQSASIGAYLDLMTQLLLENHLKDSKEDSVVRAIAQAQTTRVLRDSDPSSKQKVLLFLYDSGLISKRGRSPIIDLSLADLSEADLHFTDLGGADLRGVDLNGANLNGAVLVEADLSCAPPAYWWMKSDQDCTNLSGANLSGANLNQTNLSCAPAPEWWMETKRTGCVDLREANLSGADLTFADLSGANLTGADVTQERLDEQATLLGARMPNGQQYEEWVADRKGGGEEVTKRVAQDGCEDDPAVVNAPSDYRQKALNDCVESILD
jgi:hypothetical protein